MSHKIKVCPIFSVVSAIHSYGHNIDPQCVCLKEDCMFFNMKNGICAISGQLPNEEE